MVAKNMLDKLTQDNQARLRERFGTPEVATAREIGEALEAGYGAVPTSAGTERLAKDLEDAEPFCEATGPIPAREPEFVQQMRRSIAAKKEKRTAASFQWHGPDGNRCRSDAEAVVFTEYERPMYSPAVDKIIYSELTDFGCKPGDELTKAARVEWLRLAFAALDQADAVAGFDGLTGIRSDIGRMIEAEGERPTGRD